MSDENTNIENTDESPKVDNQDNAQVITEEIDTTTFAEAEENLKALDLDTADYNTKKKLVKELNITVTDMTGATLTEALKVKKAELETTPSLLDSAPVSGSLKENNSDIENAELRKEMQEYFDYNPEVDTFYVSSDGMPFYRKEDAEMQQASINKELSIEIVKR